MKPDDSKYNPSSNDVMKRLINFISLSGSGSGLLWVSNPEDFKDILETIVDGTHLNIYQFNFDPSNYQTRETEAIERYKLINSEPQDSLTFKKEAIIDLMGNELYQWGNEIVIPTGEKKIHLVNALGCNNDQLQIGTLYAVLNGSRNRFCSNPNGPFIIPLLNSQENKSRIMSYGDYESCSNHFVL
jgi:hypothetical protein